MPAIQLARLKMQAARLREFFSNPQAFLRALHGVLDSYADRAQRPGQSGEPSPLISSYHVPAPVLRQILLELTPLISSAPDQALQLCDLLWAQPNLECRTLAASMLGNLPLTCNADLWARVEQWAMNEKEEKLVEQLLTLGLARRRREAAKTVLNKIETWIRSENLHEKRLGLLALRPFLDETPLEAAPTLYRLLADLIRAAPPRLQPDLLSILRQMARLSPVETAHFLRQNLDASNSPDALWLMRRLLSEFPSEIRSELQQALRAAKT